MTFEEARKQLNSGRRMSPGEYRFLSSLVTGGTIVDIGAWMGFSTRVLAQTLIDKQLDGFVLAIDPHTLETAGKHKGAIERTGQTSSVPFLEANLEEWGVADRVIPLAARSQDVASDISLSLKERDIEREVVSLLVVDGSHFFLEVVQDFELWYPLVKKGGILVFHDYQHIPGPTKTVDQYVRKVCEEIGRVGMLIAFVKR